MQRRDAVLLLVLCAFVLRLGVALVWTPPIEADAADYDRLARALAQGRGYVSAAGTPTSWRPPLYPAFMAGVYRVAGEHPAAVRVAQAALGAGVVALVYVAAVSPLGHAPALFAAALTAADVGAVTSVSRLLSEGLFTLLLLAGVAAVLAARRASGRRAPALGAAAGVALGLATLTRAALLLLPLVLVPAWLWFDRGRSRAPHRAALATVVGFALALAPWAARNTTVHGTFVPVATQGGLTLYAGNNPVNGWIFGLIPSDDTTRAAERLPEAEASAWLTEVTTRELIAHPGRLPRLIALKAAFFWVPLDWEVLPWYGALNPTYAFALVWMTALVVSALRRADRRDALARSWPFWVPVLYMFGMALAFYGSPRFRLPLEPIFAVAAAAGLARLAERRGVRVARGWAIASAVAVLALALMAGPAKAVLRGWIAS